MLDALTEAGRRDVRVYNVHHNAGATAELACALIFSLARRIVPCDRALRHGNWAYRAEVTSGRSGARLLYNGNMAPSWGSRRREPPKAKIQKQFEPKPKRPPHNNHIIIIYKYTKYIYKICFI